MKSMRLAIVGSAMLVLLAVGFSAAADMTYSGEIMDSSCAKMGPTKA